MKYIFCRSIFSSNKIFRKVLVSYLLKCEGGQFKSSTLRRLYSEQKNIKVGIGSYGWVSEAIDGPADIGNYVSLGPGVRRICVNYYTDGVSTHPCYFNPVYGWVKQDPRKKTRITIGNDVWIGANSIILPNVVSIGNGAVIAAGSVVTKNVSPYEIWGGVPAKLIRKRFDDNTISRIEHSKWWDLPEEKLKKYSDLFNNPDAFLSKLGY